MIFLFPFHLFENTIIFQTNFLFLSCIIYIIYNNIKYKYLNIPVAQIIPLE